MKIDRLTFFWIAILFLLPGLNANTGTGLDGHWHAVWISSGGEIPVDLFIKRTAAGQLEAEVRNGPEIVRFSRVETENNHIEFYIDHFESRISADLSENGESMTGNWSKQTGNPNRMPFYAVKGDLERFPRDKFPAPIKKALISDASGTWRLRFEGDDYDSVCLFEQKGERLFGTIRAVDGDFRWLEGVYRNGLLLLSSFNGSWVFIFKAELDEKGVLRGFWARGPREPVRWTAVKQEATLPDPFGLTQLTNKEGMLRLKYPMAEDPQHLLSLSDSEFSGKPLLVIFATTGCPNSHQLAVLLSQLYKDYHPRGLNMLGVFFELTKDIVKTQTRIKRFKEEYDLPFPFLFSLAMSKEEISKEIPDFKTFLAWPTVAFIGSNGKVAAICTGIDGPATGKYYAQLVMEYRQKIENLLLSKSSAFGKARSVGSRDGEPERRNLNN
jgi:thiol-disulfide isomerase/thioredoxin